MIMNFDEASRCVSEQLLNRGICAKISYYFSVEKPHQMSDRDYIFAIDNLVVPDGYLIYHSSKYALSLYRKYEISPHEYLGVTYNGDVADEGAIIYFRVGEWTESSTAFKRTRILGIGGLDRFDILGLSEDEWSVELAMSRYRESGREGMRIMELRQQDIEGYIMKKICQCQVEWWIHNEHVMISAEDKLKWDMVG